MFLELAYGVIVGIIVSIPFGGIGTLCLSLTLNKGLRYGILLALFIIVGDTILILFGTIFYNMLSHIIEKYEYLIKFLTPIVLFLVAFKILYNVYKKKLHKKINYNDTFKNIIIVFLLSLFNPATLIIMITVFNMLGINKISNHMLFVLGFLLSSLILWLIYIALMLKIKNNLNLRLLYKINLYIGYSLFFIGFSLFIL